MPCLSRPSFPLLDPSSSGVTLTVSGSRPDSCEQKHHQPHLEACQSNTRFPRRSLFRFGIHPLLLFFTSVLVVQDCPEFEVEDAWVGIRLGKVLQHDGLWCSVMSICT